MPKKLNWYRIATDIAEIPFAENNLAAITCNGKQICIGRHQDKIFAFTQKCPHASGYLSDGYIDPLGNVVCPLHRYRFNMDNGRNTSGEGYYLKTYPLELREDGVWTGMEESGFSLW